VVGLPVIVTRDAARYEKDIKTFFEGLLREDQQLARDIMSKMGTKAQQAFDSMASKVFTKENITSELLTLLRKLDKDGESRKLLNAILTN